MKHQIVISLLFLIVSINFGLCQSNNKNISVNKDELNNSNVDNKDFNVVFLEGPYGKQEFIFDQSYILVKLLPSVRAMESDYLKTRYKKSLDVSPFEVSSLGLSIYKVDEDSDVSFNELTKEINKDENIDFFNYSLKYKDGTRIFILPEIYIKLKNIKDLDWLREYCETKKLGLPSKMENKDLVYSVSVSEDRIGDVISISNEVYRTGKVVFAEPKYLSLMKPFFSKTKPSKSTKKEITNIVMATNDPLNSEQWYQDNKNNANADMDIPQGWQITTGNPSVKIAVIDEGVDIQHPDLKVNILPGYDATGQGSLGNYQGDDAHGTACAGIIAASANNGVGLAGNAYNCKIIPIRMAYSGPDIDGDGEGDWVTSNIWASAAIDWAYINGADVLSNSWGGGNPSALIESSIIDATIKGRGGKGSVVLFSSGNDNSSDVKYPARFSSAIAVGAMSMCNERKNPDSCDSEDWWGSDYGEELDVSAPGVKIVTCDISGSAGYNINGDYTDLFNGTSSACPNAASVAALLLSKDQSLSQLQVRSILEKSCDKVGGYSYQSNPNQSNGTWSEELGYGKVNALKALEALSSRIVGVEPKEIRYKAEFRESKEIIVTYDGPWKAIYVPKNQDLPEYVILAQNSINELSGKEGNDTLLIDSRVNIIYPIQLKGELRFYSNDPDMPSDQPFGVITVIQEATRATIFNLYSQNNFQYPDSNVIIRSDNLQGIIYANTNANEYEFIIDPNGFVKDIEESNVGNFLELKVILKNKNEAQNGAKIDRYESVLIKYSDQTGKDEFLTLVVNQPADESGYLNVFPLNFTIKENLENKIIIKSDVPWKVVSKSTNINFIGSDQGDGKKDEELIFAIPKNNSSKIVSSNIEIEGTDNTKNPPLIISRTISIKQPALRSNESSLLIYPNPNNGLFNVQLNKNILNNIYVYNSLSQIVYSELGVFSNQKNIDLDHLESGSYILVVQNENGTSYNQFIIIK